MGSVLVIMFLGTPAPTPSKSCNRILVYRSYIDTYGSVPIEIMQGLSYNRKNENKVNNIHIKGEDTCIYK